jgi:hypothetical protein
MIFALNIAQLVIILKSAHTHLIGQHKFWWSNKLHTAGKIGAYVIQSTNHTLHPVKQDEKNQGRARKNSRGT